MKASESNIEEIIGKVKASQYHFGTAVRENNSIKGKIDVEKLSKLERLVKLTDNCNII